MKQMTQRQTQVAEELRHIAASAMLRGEIPTTVDLTRVTVVNTWVSADLRLGRLYVDLPDAANQAATLEALNRQVAGPLRKVVAKRLATKYIPEISFHASENDR